MRTDFGASVVYNIERAIAGGLVLSVLALVASIVQGTLSSDAGILASGLLLCLIAPLGMLPGGLIAALLLRMMGTASGPVAGVFRLTFGVMWLISLATLMLGDPIIVLLNHIAPRIVPVDQPKLWNPYMLIKVERPADNAIPQ